MLLEGVPGDDKRRIMRASTASSPKVDELGKPVWSRRTAWRNRRSSGGVNRVVMASDGDLNVGISSESRLHDFVEQKRETGVYLSAGIRLWQLQDNKMETLADHGNGAYHYRLRRRSPTGARRNLVEPRAACRRCEDPGGIQS
ncbi:MAG: hypothetical protein ACLT98_12650 [Eggerthellaceae bacterium]